ncbi:MAG: hypothetical protein IH861_07420 [Chloroflexi bacterium]|nr:hypothetical protein [Chloroflexota bacterium]
MAKIQDTDAWWGTGGRKEGRPSVLDLIDNETMDVRTAALLWLLAEHKTSFISAAVPQLAGKSTIATTLIDFLPPKYERVLSKGRDEDFSFLETSEPSNTYVMVPELSDHTPRYLWGDNVRRLFEALRDGYSFIATMHAENPQHLISQLNSPPAGVPMDLVHHVQVVVNIWMDYGEHGIIRRVSEISALSPGPTVITLGRRLDLDGPFEHIASDETVAILKQFTGLSEDGLESALAGREETLRQWLLRLPLSVADVQAKIEGFYGSN